MNKQYDKNTLGNSPAVIYLIDILNSTENPKDHSVLKLITKFKMIFKQLTTAYDSGAVDVSVVRAFSTLKRIELNQNFQVMIDEGYTPLVVNLYKNIIIADMKKFERGCDKMFRVQRSAIDRAKSMLKNRHLKFAGEEISTYGRIDKINPEVVEVVVVFDKHGLPALETPLTRHSIKEEITDETLMKKSVARLTRLGKMPYSNL